MSFKWQVNGHGYTTAGRCADAMARFKKIIDGLTPPTSIRDRRHDIAKDHCSQKIY
jgi:hypothetical protein